MLCKLLLYSLAFGMILGAFYDVNRIIRVFFGVRYTSVDLGKLSDLKLPFIKRPVSLSKKKRKSDIFLWTVISLGDILCFLCAAVGIAVLNYSYNSGSFRAFTVIGVVAGFIFYYFTVGKLVMLISEPLAMLFKYVFLSIFVIFGYPFYIIGKNVRKKLAKTVFLCSFTLEKRKQKVYNIKEEVCLLEMSKNGFLK